jgi:tRNA threonylcarbamoyladenosine biosynthesis protein TsaB
MTSPISSPTDGKLILAVDTSTAGGSLALAEGKNSVLKILSERRWDKLAMHSEVATLEVAEALSIAGFSLHNVTHFVVNVGPGSFTGLRVGINMVRTFAYALNKPVAKFSSLEVLAFANSLPGEKALVAIKAIQNFYYFAVYENLGGSMKTLVGPKSGTLSEIHEQKFIGKTLIEGDVGEIARASARTLVQLSVSASFSSWKTVKPLYVRASEAEEKLKKGILKALP